MKISKKPQVFTILIGAILVVAQPQQAQAHAGGHGGLDWPAVIQVDEALHEVQVDQPGAADQVAKLKQAIEELAATPFPEKLFDPLGAKLILDDLVQAAAAIPDTATPSELQAAIASLHELLSDLMEVAGMDHDHHHH